MFDYDRMVVILVRVLEMGIIFKYILFLDFFCVIGLLMYYVF